MAHDIIPILDKVVIKPEKKMEQTEGGIYIPESAQKKGRVGYAIAVGEEVKTVQEGDKVFFGDYVGTWIKVDKVEYIVIVEQDIMVVLKEKEEEKTEPMDVVTDAFPMADGTF